jgi:hypothetical protein
LRCTCLALPASAFTIRNAPTCRRSICLSQPQPHPRQGVQPPICKLPASLDNLTSRARLLEACNTFTNDNKVSQTQTYQVQQQVNNHKQGRRDLSHSQSGISAG